MFVFRDSPTKQVEDEKKAQITSLLKNTLLSALCIDLVGLGIALIWFPNMVSLSIFIAVFILISFGITLLIPAQRIELIAMLTMFAGWATATIEAFYSGSPDETTLLGFVAVVVVAALVLGRHGLITFALLSMVAWSGLFWAEARIEAVDLTSLQEDWWLGTLIFMWIVTFLYFAIRKSDRILDQAVNTAMVLARTVNELRATTVSKTYLDNIIQSMGDMLIVIGPDGRIELVNQSALNVLGYQEDELIGLSFDAVLVEQVEGRTGITTIMEDGISHHAEKFYRTRDGGLIPVSFSGRAMRDEAELIRIVTVARDITLRKQAEKSLRESEAKHRILLNCIRSPVLALNTDMTILYCNDAYTRLMGQPASELEGQKLLDVFPEFEQTQSYDAYVQALETRETLKIEGKIEDAYVQVDIYPTPWGILAIAEDITEKKLVREALEQQRDFIYQVMNQLGQGVAVTNALGEYEFVNPAYAQIVGYEPEELIGKHPAAIALVEDQHILQRALQEQQRGESLSYELRLQRKDGRQIHVFVTSVPRWQDDQVIGSTTVTVDLTQLIQARQSLQESEARNRALLNSIPDLLFVLNRDGTFLDYHAGVPDLLFTPPETFLGKNMREILPHELVDLLTDRFDEAQTTGKPQSIEYTLPLNNETHYFEGRVVAYDSDKVLTIVRDITERKATEQQLLQLSIEKERVNLLANFVRDISHDFRTPLATINTSVYLLQRSADAEKHKRHLDVIVYQIEHLTKLLEMMLFMMRLDSAVKFKSQSIDLSRLVRDVGVGMQDMATHRQVQVEFELSDSLPAYHADQEFMTRAVVSLVENAIQYTPDGGVVTLRTYQQDGSSVIEVSDTGIGIVEQDMPRIFDRFFRADRARSTETGGVGLGLSIAKKVIEAHGGHIEVTSESGKGSTFRVLFTNP